MASPQPLPLGRETIAVMDGSRIICNDGRSWPLHPERLGDGVLYAHVLAKTARDLGLHQIWIHASWPGVLDWTTPGHAAANGAGRWTFGDIDNPKRGWHVCFQAGTYGAVDIVESWKIPGPLREAATADELLAALVQFARGVGVEFKRSPGATGVTLIKWAHGFDARGSVRPGVKGRPLALELPGDPPAPALAGNTEMPRQWIRDLTPAEHARGYLHSYDKNMMYVAACSSLPLGVGQAVHTLAGSGHDWPGARTSKTGKRVLPPGYWRVHVGRYNGPKFELSAELQHTPNPFPLPWRLSRKNGDSRIWITTPSLNLLYELGYECCVTEAYTWPTSHRYLEQWYHAIRTARVDMDAAEAAGQLGAALAVATLKESYAAASGRLSTRLWDRAEDRLYRPDWRHAMIAQANANVYRQGLEAARQGFYPFALGTDAWYYISDEPDPVKACPPALNLDTTPGAWKVKDSVPLADILPVIDAGAGHYNALQRLQKALNLLRRGLSIPGDLLGDDEDDGDDESEGDE